MCDLCWSNIHKFIVSCIFLIESSISINDCHKKKLWNLSELEKEKRKGVKALKNKVMRLKKLENDVNLDKKIVFRLFRV